MLGTYHAKFQVFMSKGSAINWAAISDFDWPPLQIQIWPGITERTGTWGGVLHPITAEKKRDSFSSQIKFKTKIKIKTLFRLIIRRYTSWIHTDYEYFWSSCERGLTGWRHRKHRCCKIQRAPSLRTKQWRTSFYDFWRVISREKKLRRTRFMVISLRLDLYLTFLRKKVWKNKWKISS